MYARSWRPFPPIPAARPARPPSHTHSKPLPLAPTCRHYHRRHRTRRSGYDVYPLRTLRNRTTGPARSARAIVHALNYTLSALSTRWLHHRRHSTRRGGQHFASMLPQSHDQPQQHNPRHRLRAPSRLSLPPSRRLHHRRHSRHRQIALTYHRSSPPPPQPPHPPCHPPPTWSTGASQSPATTQRTI